MKLGGKANKNYLEKVRGEETMNRIYLGKGFFKENKTIQQNQYQVPKQHDKMHYNLSFHKLLFLS